MAQTTIRDWLTTIGLAQYAELFEANDIDFELLPKLAEAHLELVGVRSLGHRLRILEGAAQLETSLRQASRSQVAPPQARPRTEPAADRRQLTVMFCDLVGSTALSQALDPEHLRELMHAYQQACGEVIEKYGGHVAQYLGDGLMVYFGWPQAHEDDAERAARAALEICTAVKSVFITPPLRVRIGIATGPVVVGETGEGDASVPKVAVGETPNLAARLQGLAGPDEIVTAQSTQRLAGAGFDYQDLGEHSLKGIVEPVKAYRVRRVVPVEGRFEASHQLQLTPLVGRESEIALLLDRWEYAKSGEGHGVLLSAEAGIGKSRVTRALRGCLGDEPHLSMHYQCSPFHSNSEFYPIIEQFERAAKFAHEDSPDVRIAKMEALLEKAGVDVAEVAPLFAALLSLPTERYPRLNLSPQQQKERTIAAQLAQVIGLANQQPVMVVLEDAHWADPSTLEVFGALLERIETSRVLLIITYRPEFNPPWIGQHRVTALTLSRLSKKETASLAERVSGKPLPVEVLDQILAKTDGVPLFIEELTKAVLESGLLEDRGDRYALSQPLPAFAIPSTLHDSLMARLDRLAPVKELIQLGAVIGRQFSHALITRLASIPESQLQVALEQLVDSGLVYRRGSAPGAVYVFKHALVQDAAYGSILKSRCQQLHATVASMLEHDAQIAQSEPEFLAFQFERAGLTTKAIEWYTAAGQRATMRSANKEALHHFKRALALLDVDGPSDAQERRIDVNIELGFIHFAMEGWASRRSREHFSEAERLGRDDQQSERRFRMLVGLIPVLTWTGHGDNAKSHCEELVSLAERTRVRLHRLYAHQLLGQSYMTEGKFGLALAEFQQAMLLYDEAADAQLAFRYGNDAGLVALWWTAYMQFETGLLSQSLRSKERALALARRIAHPFSLACALMWTLDLSYHMWLPDKILLHAEEAIGVAQRYGFSQLEIFSLVHHGWAVAHDCPDESAIDQMTHALSQYRDLGEGAVVSPRLTAELASVYGKAGRAEEGLRVLQTSPDRELGRTRVRYAETSRIEGELHLQTVPPDQARAEAFFKEAVSIAIEDEAKTKHLRAATSLAKLWQTQGKLGEARTLLEPLYNSFTEGFDMPDLHNARTLLERLGARAA